LFILEIVFLVSIWVGGDFGEQPLPKENTHNLVPAWVGEGFGGATISRKIAEKDEKVS